MTFRVLLSHEARAALDGLANSDPVRHRKVRKTLGLMESNIRSQGLQTHEFRSLTGPGGEKVYEAYVESNTPAAYRVFWYYGPERGEITVIAITAHP